MTGSLLLMLLLPLLLLLCKASPLSCAVTPRPLCPDPRGSAPFQRQTRHPNLSRLSWGAAPAQISPSLQCSFRISQTQLWQSPTQIAPDIRAEAPLPAPPATPRRPRQRAASPGSNFNPEEGANRSFSKLFQSDSDKQIAGSPGG